MLQRWPVIAVLGLTSIVAAGDPLPFCPASETAGEAVSELTCEIHFDFQNKTFITCGEDPPVIPQGVSRVRFPLMTKCQDCKNSECERCGDCECSRAARYTGSPYRGSPPPVCSPKVEEDPTCDSDPVPFSQRRISNKKQLSPACVEAITLRDVLCVEQLDARFATLRVKNDQECGVPVNVSFILLVKETMSVTVNGRDYRRQFQTSDPTIILQPMENGGG